MKAFIAILWLLTMACWGLIFLMTHGASEEVRQVPTLGLHEIANHFLAFGLLGGLLCLSLWAMFPKRPYFLWLALPALLIYAGIDEKTRTLVTPSAQMRHWLADAAGASVAVTGMYFLCGLSRLLRRSTPHDGVIASDGIRPIAASAATAGLVSNSLGLEVEAALASYTDTDAEVGEQIIRVEKTSAPSPKSIPVRAQARRAR